MARGEALATRDRNVTLAWGLALAWMLLIFVLSSQGGLGGQQWPPLLQALRKLGHVIEYAVLGILLGWALLVTWSARNTNTGPSASPATPRRTLLARAWLWGAILATLYAVTDELHQGFVPGRGPHLEDVIIDALSAIAALGIWYIMLNTNVKRKT
jgi:VanZ family protein